MKLHNRPTMKDQDYQILSCPVGHPLADVCAQFKYRGFIISFSTNGYADYGCCNEVQYWAEHSSGVELAYSVEAAIQAIDAYHKQEYDRDCPN